MYGTLAHGSDAKDTFAALDTDSDGTATVVEFLKFLRVKKGENAKSMGFFLKRMEKAAEQWTQQQARVNEVELSDAETEHATALFDRVDADSSGHVSLEV